MSEHPAPALSGARVFIGILVAAAIVVLGVYNAVSPVRQGLLDDALTFSSSLTVPALNASEPAAKAGLRPGDRILYFKMPRSDQLNSVYPRSAVPVRLLIERGGKERQFTIVPDQFRDFTWGRYPDLALEIAYSFVACLILVRARRGALSNTLAAYIFSLATNLAGGDANFSMPSFGTVIVFDLIPVGASYAFLTWSAFRLIGLFPPEPSRARRFALAFAPIAGIIASVFIFTPFRFLFAERLYNPLVNASVWGEIVTSIVGIGILLWSSITVSEQQRARMRWFASTLIVFQFLDYALNGVFGTWFPTLTIAYWITYYAAALAPVGPVYATLRHRLVDLDFVISRSAVYAVLSLFIVAVFVGIEWLVGKFMDAFAGQALSFLIAIAIGVSVRRGHALLEKRLNGVFYRARTRRLASLERFAQETDLVDSPQALLHLTYEAMVESVESPAVALYMADGDGYACVRSSDATAPERLDKNNRLTLRILRWPQAFNVDEAALHNWLVVPLVVRMRVIGFLCCGPKIDHTAYAEDEVSALQTLAHHVATSYAFVAGPALTAGV